MENSSVLDYTSEPVGVKSQWNNLYTRTYFDGLSVPTKELSQERALIRANYSELNP